LSDTVLNINKNYGFVIKRFTFLFMLKVIGEYKAVGVKVVLANCKGKNTSTLCANITCSVNDKST